MKIKIKVEKEFDIEKLQVNAGVRYWEDATVDGVEDESGDLIPCREGDRWCPTIDIESGHIINWKLGVVADIHYKVCDDGEYTLEDEDSNPIKHIEGYVPNIMCPEGNGYGDYIIMKVDADGRIENWKQDLSDWNNED
jgi:hypothetical protein